VEVLFKIILAKAVLEHKKEGEPNGEDLLVS
jgi:hypothetical protein